MEKFVKDIQNTGCINLEIDFVSWFYIDTERSIFMVDGKQYIYPDRVKFTNDTVDIQYYFLFKGSYNFSKANVSIDKIGGYIVGIFYIYGTNYTGYTI